jgi:hypothetical protein
MEDRVSKGMAEEGFEEGEGTAGAGSPASWGVGVAADIGPTEGKRDDSGPEIGVRYQLNPWIGISASIELEEVLTLRKPTAEKDVEK